MNEDLIPYFAGAGTLFVVCMLCKLQYGTWNPLVFGKGADGRPSTSKMQFWLWTLVVLFAYSALYAARVERGYFAAIPEFPHNLLLAMGFSIATAAGAKGITVSYVRSGQLVQDRTDSKKGGVLQDDKGNADLAKMQLMAWTYVAVVIYLINLVHRISFTKITDVKQLQLPDIDGSLMVLMGLGNGAYLGKKLITTTAVRLTGLSPSSAKANDPVTLSGQEFGGSQNGSQITIDDLPLAGTWVVDWKEAQIRFKIPDTHPSGAAWTRGQRITIGVIAGGQESANRLPLTIDV